MRASVAKASPTSPGRWPGDWHADVLEGFEASTRAVNAELLPGETEVVATLVRRTEAADPQRDERPRAVLCLPGFNDYFFHVHVAQALEAQGFTVYALDPRRSGRSAREPEYRDYVASMDDYAEELDAAYGELASRHDSITFMAHSTGGLWACRWASTHPGALAGLVLNSPWLAMWGPPGFGEALGPGLAALARRDPLRRLRVPDPGDRYARSIHVDYGGDWNYDLELKVRGPVPIRAGWLAAVLRAQRQLARGAQIDCPVLVCVSAAESRPAKGGWTPQARVSDAVLSPTNIARRVASLGDHVTLVRIPQGFHDLALSIAPARARYLDEVTRWLAAYVASGGVPSADAPAESQ